MNQELQRCLRGKVGKNWNLIVQESKKEEKPRMTQTYVLGK